MRSGPHLPVLLLAMLMPPSLVGAQPAPCAACIVVSIAPGQALAMPDDLEGLDIVVRVGAGQDVAATAALQAIEARHGRAGLHVVGLPLQAIGAAPLSLATTLVIELGAEPAPDPAQLAFALKTRITEARAAARTGIRVGVAASPDLAVALLARDLAPYLDFIVWLGPPPTDTGTPAAWRAAGLTIARVDDVSSALRLSAGGDTRWLWRAPDDVLGARSVMNDLARSAAWLRAGLFESTGIDVRCGPSRVQTFMDPETLDTIAVAYDCPATRSIEVQPPQSGVERVTLSGGTSIVRVPSPAEQGRFAETVQVGAARRLTVNEIIARHQAAAARQATLVTTLISTGTLTLTFEAPGFPAPITISSQAILYVGKDRSEIEQRAIRVNGVEFRGGGVPKLPIIEPERVASPPLTITLSDVYRYALAGEESVGGVHCYVVAFDPVDARKPLFRGRAWIAADSFAMVRVAAAQTGLRGPVTSSEQTDECRKARDGVWLLARSDVRQIYEGAAYRTPIHRVLVIDAHEIDPPAFEARRTAAYSSDSIILRDTPQGFRYLQHERAPAAPGAPTTVPAIAGRADRVRTLAAGVIIDPNITRPLPFAGISYLDFDLLGTGAQFNGFFGGTYAQAAFSAPSLGGTRWQFAGRGFAIASSYNDRAFVAGRERYDENIRQRPASAAVWLLRPLTPRISVRLGYDLDYTHFAAADLTAQAFRVPADQVVHAARVALEGQRGGWNFSIWMNPARRSGWRAWGREGASDYSPRQRDFLRYGATVVRSSVLAPRLVGRVEAAWMAGRDLDRFSRYSFGTFDNRLRGYPSALIRYDRGGVARGALAWAATRLMRIDGFLDTAAVHDPGFGRGVRNYTGIGAAAEAPAPFGTLIAVEWGYGIQGINSSGSRGTQVIRISGYKVF